MKQRLLFSTADEFLNQTGRGERAQATKKGNQYVSTGCR
jgi:hypothetical protein